VGERGSFLGLKPGKEMEINKQTQSYKKKRTNANQNSMGQKENYYCEQLSGGGVHPAAHLSKNGKKTQLLLERGKLYPGKARRQPFQRSRFLNKGEPLKNQDSSRGCLWGGAQVPREGGALNGPVTKGEVGVASRGKTWGGGNQESKLGSMGKEKFTMCMRQK